MKTKLKLAAAFAALSMIVCVVRADIAEMYTVGGIGTKAVGWGEMYGWDGSTVTFLQSISTYYGGYYDSGVDAGFVNYGEVWVLNDWLDEMEHGCTFSFGDNHMFENLTWEDIRSQ